MNNPQMIAEIIEKMAKDRSVSISTMLTELEMNKNALFTMKKSGYLPRAESLCKIADYLDCSVDYLLGRTDTPQVSQNNVIHTGDITGNHNANINSKDNSDTQELLELIKSLPLVKRAEAIILINDLKKKENG